MGQLTKEQAKVKREALRKAFLEDPEITTTQLLARGYKEKMIRSVRKELKMKPNKDSLFLTKAEKKKLHVDKRKTNNDLFG